MSGINVSKGLFRLWVFMTVLWVLFWTWFNLNGNPDNVFFGFFAPPICVLLLGLSIAWVIKGFKQSTQ